MEKRGSGQVEMILSFVIFLGFIIFLFAVFPIYREEKSSIGISSAEKGILKEAGVKIGYFTVSLNETPAQNCFCFKDSSTGIMIAKNINLGKAAAKSGSGNVCIQGTEKFYQIYISDAFETIDFITANCQIIEERKYMTGLKRAIDAVSYDKLIELKNSYESDYESLKDSLGIPAGENFGFRIVDLRGTEILNAVKVMPKRVEVQAKNLPVQIFYSNGDSAFAMLNILTW